MHHLHGRSRRGHDEYGLWPHLPYGVLPGVHGGEGGHSVGPQVPYVQAHRRRLLVEGGCVFELWPRVGRRHSAWAAGHPCPSRRSRPWIRFEWPCGSGGWLFREKWPRFECTCGSGGWLCNGKRPRFECTCGWLSRCGCGGWHHPSRCGIGPEVEHWQNAPEVPRPECVLHDLRKSVCPQQLPYPRKERALGDATNAATR